jgi:hypothetical protein
MPKPSTSSKENSEYSISRIVTLSRAGIVKTYRVGNKLSSLLRFCDKYGYKIEKISF